MCRLIETIRVENGTIHHLPYHQYRVESSIGTGFVCLESHLRTLSLPPHGCFRLRLVYTRAGIAELSLTPYTPRHIRTFRIIAADSLCYPLKCEERSALNRLWEQRGECDEILITQNNRLTDTSFANLALFDGKRWVTPDQPLLPGTCRARLIEEKVLTPVPVFVHDLWKYRQLLLINALLGFNPAQAIPISEAVR